MRELSLARSSRKLTDLRDTALYSFTGTFKSPQLIDPLQIALAIVPHQVTVRSDKTHRSTQFPNLASLPGYPSCDARNLAHRLDLPRTFARNRSVGEPAADPGFRPFEICNGLQERYGYPELTRERK